MLEHKVGRPYIAEGRSSAVTSRCSGGKTAPRTAPITSRTPNIRVVIYEVVTTETMIFSLT